MSAFYWKNLPVWERIGRALVALAVTVAGFAVFGGGLWGWLIAISAIGFGMTGIVGFCPICAMFGRRLKTVSKDNAAV